MDARVWRLVLDLHLLLGFDRLVNAFGPAPTRHGSPGVLIDDHDLAAGDHVVHVALEQGVRFQRRVHMMQQVQVAGRVEAVAFVEQAHTDQLVFHLLVTDLGQLHLAVLFVHHEVAGWLFFQIELGLSAPQTAAG